jgi:hypothetical protein
MQNEVRFHIQSAKGVANGFAGILAFRFLVENPIPKLNSIAIHPAIHGTRQTTVCKRMLYCYLPRETSSQHSVKRGPCFQQFDAVATERALGIRLVREVRAANESIPENHFFQAMQTLEAVRLAVLLYALSQLFL